MPGRVRRALAGALLLARGRAEGVQAYPPALEEARFSFLAAALCLPLFLLLRGSGGAAAADPLRGLVADLIAYAISWAGFALASLPMAQAMGRAALWPRLIAAWNWTNAVQYALLGLLSLPALFGLAGWVTDVLGLAGLGYAVWLQWFAARSALQVDGVRAAGFVAVDLAIAIFLTGLVARLAPPG